jgi:sugar phosphate isomerase/epimerase
MSIGLGTYSFFWRSSDRVSAPMDLPTMFAATADLGVDTFQICDYPAVHAMSETEISDIRAAAVDAGLTLELGVRGVRADGLSGQLRLAQQLGATLVRSMIHAGDDRPTTTDAERELTVVMPAFEAAGVTLALETYEQISTDDLADLIESVDSPNLGICLDVANVIARLEDQRRVIDRVAPLVKNLHVKDFQFSRAQGLVGFDLAGAALGQGLLDLEYLVAVVRPFERGMSEIVEHWLPWQESAETTIAREEEWTGLSISALRSIQEAHKSTG